MENILSGIPDLIESIGFFQTIVLLLVLMVGFSVIKGRVLKNDSAAETVANAVIPLTCAWGDQERSTLLEMRHDIEEISKRVERTHERVISIDARMHQQ